MADVDAGRHLMDASGRASRVVANRRLLPLIKYVMKLKLRHLREGPKQILFDVGVEGLELLALRSRALDVPVLLAEGLVVNFAGRAAVYAEQYLEDGEAGVVHAHKLAAFARELQLVTLSGAFRGRNFQKILLASGSWTVPVVQQL